MGDSPFSAAALQQAIMNSGARLEQPAAPAAPHQGVGMLPYLALGAGQSADALSTAYNFSRGFRESNPLFKDAGLGKLMAIKGGETAALATLMHFLGKNHPQLAKALGYVGGAAGAVPAAINLSADTPQGKQ